MGILIVSIKIILSIVLVILSLLLLILIIVLFDPIKYYSYIHYDKELKMDIKLSWIFKIVKFSYLSNGDDKKIVLKILWFQLIGKDDEVNQRKKSSNKIKNKKIKNNKTKNNKTKNHKTKNHKKQEIQERQIKTTEEKINIIPEDVEENKNIENTNIKDKKIKNKKNKKIKEKLSLKDKIKNITNKIKLYKSKLDYVKDYPNKKEIIDYTMGCLKELIIALKPKEFKFSALLGLEDPFNTGIIIGVASAISAMLGINIEIIGDFEDEVIKIDTSIKGKTTLFALLYPLVKYILKKPIWQITMNLLSRKGDSNE